MKLENKGREILDITRAKAKQYEFGIEEEYHVDLPQDPKRLLVFTIGVLGELAALESRPSDEREGHKQELKQQLVLAGQFFESLSLSRLTTEIDEYLKILSSASYYLADMPGSSLVLARAVATNPPELTSSRLECLLVWLLKSELNQNFALASLGSYNDQIRRLAMAYRAFINMEADLSDVEDELNEFRSTVYASGSDREVLLVDTINALIKRKINNSSLICLPKYTGLEQNRWHQTLANEKFMKEFWPAQRLVGRLGVLKGESAVMQMPTSAGKTKSIELIIRSGFLSGRAKLAVIVAPFRALCREITQGFMESFEHDPVNINELRDVTSVDEDEQEFLKFLLGEDFKGKHDHTVIVSTPEKLVYLLRHEPSLAKKIDLLIFDEGHQFDSGKRGVTYELLIASLKKTIPENAQKVLISAVMSNAGTIGDWLNGESSLSIQGSNWLPSIKSVAFLSWFHDMGQLSYLRPDNKRDSGLYVPKIIQQSSLALRGKEWRPRLFPIKTEVQSISCYLGLRLCQQGPTAIFCGDKRTVISLCSNVVDVYKRGLSLPTPSSVSDADELQKIAFLSNLHFSDQHIFSESIPLGVLPHSSAIPNGLRIAVEWAMNKGAGHLVVCTSTLAQGVNLPIKYLLISNLMQGGKRISTREFQNLIGRAGRAGYHTEGSIIFTDPKIYDNRFHWSGGKKWERTLKLLNFNNAEDCMSSLMEIVQPFPLIKGENDVLDFVLNPLNERLLWRKWCEENEIPEDSSIELMQDFDKKEEVLHSIESYFMSTLKDDSTLLSTEYFLDLAYETLAYYLATDVAKDQLVAIFSAIHSRLSVTPVEKFSYYGRTLLGLDQLIYIESWIESQLFELEFCDSPQDFLEVCWPLITMFSRKKITSNIYPQEEAVKIAAQWCNEISYAEILAYAKSNSFSFRAKNTYYSITQEHIVDFCSSLSYDGMLIVGAVGDIVEGKAMSETLLNHARLLQNQLKFGLSDEFKIWLHGQGFPDREVCKFVSQKLESVRENKNIIDYKILKNNKEVLKDALSMLPSAFLAPSFFG
ncbi:DEAD/DEAH box helicase [Pseudomonas sp. VE 196-7]|uniref:DEAD/DEAH box helicase n=1 Tax=Pseudomonas sp. VE 196-7 TaxID=2956726 RepID=UPI0021D517EB|nr:DEAD/DEAH box helicase [Pseudomonas sp. VE 196-7]MCU7216347.1 DEAD/DEAH box helicase [Pseudomonas sp. VE 196-7]